VLGELEESLLSHVQTLGNIIARDLEALRHEYPLLIHSVRGRGLMLGLVLSEDASLLRDALLRRGIITNATATNVLRLLPPLVLSELEWNVARDALRDALAERATAQAAYTATHP